MPVKCLGGGLSPLQFVGCPKRTKQDIYRISEEGEIYRNDVLIGTEALLEKEKNRVWFLRVDPSPYLNGKPAILSILAPVDGGVLTDLENGK